MAPSSGARRGTGLKGIAGTFGAIFLGLGLFLVLRPFLLGQAMPGDLGDARFNLVLLEFFTHNLSSLLHSQPTHFLDAPFFFPWPRATNFSDTFWGDGAVFAAIHALGIEQLAAFRLWFVAGYALTYAAALVSFRKFGLGRWGAASGAFLFAFPLPMAIQVLHAQLVYRLWMPPALVAFDRFLTRRSFRAGAATVLFVGLQLAVSIYLGLFLVLLLAAWLVSSTALARGAGMTLPRLGDLRSASRGELASAGLLLLAGVAVLATVGIPYFEVQRLYGFTRSWPEVAEGLPRPVSYLLAGASRLWPNLSAVYPLPLIVEQQLFPGLAAIIPLAWFLVSQRARERHPLASRMIATAAILFVVTIDIGGFSLYRLIYAVPGFSALRAIGRIILAIMLPLSALFGMLIDDLAAAGPYVLQRRLLAFALSAFLVAECSLIGHPSSAPAAWRARLDAIEAKLPRRLPHDAVLVVATGRKIDMRWVEQQVDADAASIALGTRTLNGYSGNYPPAWHSMSDCGDIRDNIRNGRHFLAEHGFSPRPIVRGSLVLVGFSGCNLSGINSDPALVLGRTYRFAAGQAGGAFVADGFSGAESWGRWTEGENAFLFFSLAAPPREAVVVAVTATALFRRAAGKQVVGVSANGRSCGRLVLRAGAERAQATCPAGALRRGNNMLRFHITHPVRPIDLHINGDRRHLGMGLEALILGPDRRSASG